MQHKWFVLLAGLVMFSLLIAPVGMVGAQVEAQVGAPDCPPFDFALLHDKEYLKSLPSECAKAYQKMAQQNLRAMDGYNVTAEAPSQDVPDAQSTTGPTPPSGAANAQSLTYAPSPNSMVVSGVPAYIWHDGCGPTAAGMVIGYWDQTYDWLIDGSAAAQTAAVNEAIASHDGVQNHYDDYALPMDGAEPSPLPDKSEEPFGDEHDDNSIADFMKTSQSHYSNQYGWSWSSHVGPALTGYVDLVRPGVYDATSYTIYYSGDGSNLWDRLTTEIDEGRPMIFLVDSSGDGGTDHFITIVGYDEVAGVKKYAAYNTWDTNLHWYDFGPMTAGKAWGVWGGFTFDMIPGGGPDAFGYTYSDVIGYDWISASTDSGLTGDDNYSDPINIGFEFPFYGLSQTQLYFSTNGLITFGAGSQKYSNTNIPSTNTPNNLIAAFWDDLAVGSTNNAGAIYYSQGGFAPNRYFVVEWRNVTELDDSSAFSFEAILYENGDVVVQHQSLPASYYSTVGIEDSVGDEGLQYQRGSSGLSAPKAIRFYYPTTPTARVLISPLEAGGFSALGGTTDFMLTVANTGSLGVDTYDLTAASIWPVTFYAADGVTPLADSDSDGTVDTGALAQGSTVTITAKVATPGGSTLGDANSAVVTVRSSANTTKSKTTTLRTAVPAPFAQVYSDGVNGAMSLDLIQPNAQVVKKATTDGYYGSSMAMAAAPNGNFVYVWRTYRYVGSVYISEIEYTLLDHFGNTVRAVSKLMDNSGAAMNTYDSSPSVAVAPNGTIGVIWYHYLYNSSGQSNYNIYFATLDASGNLTSGPTNITNNNVWGTWDGPNIPRFYSPTIAASDDNRFILSWEKYVYDPYSDNIWYAVHDSAGVSVFPPTALTSDNMSWGSVLNSLTGGQAILTWHSSVAPAYGIPTYAVLNSGGGISKSATTLGVSDIYSTIDAVLLPNGKVALAWPTDTGVQFAILNSSYVFESGPTSATSPSSVYGYALSVTTDSSNHVIMTWLNGESEQNLFYALGDSTGTFITPPMFYKTSADYIATSWNGQGNTTYVPGHLYLPLILR